MMGHHFGVPHHSKLQRQIIEAALEQLGNAKQSGEIFYFPKTWAEARREGKVIEEGFEFSKGDT